MDSISLLELGLRTSILVCLILAHEEYFSLQVDVVVCDTHAKKWKRLIIPFFLVQIKTCESNALT